MANVLLHDGDVIFFYTSNENLEVMKNYKVTGQKYYIVNYVFETIDLYFDDEFKISEVDSSIINDVFEIEGDFASRLKVNNGEYEDSLYEIGFEENDGSDCMVFKKR